MSSIKQQSSQVLAELEANKTVTSEQKAVLRNAVSALHTAELVLKELDIADRIIKNCLNQMDMEQRSQAAIDNHIDSLSAEWAFRRADRKEMIQRGERHFGSIV